MQTNKEFMQEGHDPHLTNVLANIRKQHITAG